jgi:hypothetical protein
MSWRTQRKLSEIIRLLRIIAKEDEKPQPERISVSFGTPIQKEEKQK